MCLHSASLSTFFFFQILAQLDMDGKLGEWSLFNKYSSPTTLGARHFPLMLGLFLWLALANGIWAEVKTHHLPSQRYCTFELASREVLASTLRTACSRNLLPPSVWAPEGERWSRAIPQPPDPWWMNKCLLLKAIRISVVFYIGKIRNQEKRLLGVILVECWKPPGDFPTYRHLYFWLMSCERCYFTIPQG